MIYPPPPAPKLPSLAKHPLSRSVPASAHKQPTISPQSASSSSSSSISQSPIGVWQSYKALRGRDRMLVVSWFVGSGLLSLYFLSPDSSGTETNGSDKPHILMAPMRFLKWTARMASEDVKNK